MTKTLVEQLRTEPDPEWCRALMITAASRIEGLESALEWCVAVIQDDADQYDVTRGHPYEHVLENARSALSDKG
jgi:hypothetical protein